MSRAKKVCSAPGCPNVTDSGKCQECRPVDSRPSARERGYDTGWEKSRRAFLRENPLCCEEHCLALATDVDHRDGQGPLGPLGHDWTNLRPYCHSHHSKRTARDQPGGWHRG